MSTKLEMHVFIDVKAPGDQLDPVFDFQVKAYVKDGKFTLDLSGLHGARVIWAKPEDLIEAMHVLGVMPPPRTNPNSAAYDR